LRRRRRMRRTKTRRTTRRRMGRTSAAPPRFQITTTLWAARDHIDATRDQVHKRDVSFSVRKALH
jgi:hypothetical protein